MSELNHIQLEEARWSFCLALYNWRETGCSEGALRKISDGMKYPFSDSQIQEIMRYLEGLGYCKLETLPDGRLWALRSPKLVDLVEYNADCPPSIARPNQKYW